MTYFDAIASGRFKRVQEQWAFYPWTDRHGYLLPTREDYWRVHAWAAQIVKVWILLTVAVWVLVGPVSVPIVAVPLLVWYRRRLRKVVDGLPTTTVRLTLAESYRIRGETHSWRSLWLTATMSALVMSIAFGVAILRPELRVSGIVVGLWFAVILAGVYLMIRSKVRSEAASSGAV
jgi:hypothetical protein